MTTQAAAPQVLLHPDFLRLEQELGDRIQELVANTGRSVPRILVLAPTQRQVQRVRDVLAARFPALLGVDVLTHLAFARRTAESATTHTPGIMDRPLREALVERILAADEQRPLGRYAAEFPVVIPALTGLLGELREAGVHADELSKCAVGDRETDLARLLGELEQALADLASGKHGPARTDRAGLTSIAIDLLEGEAKEAALEGEAGHSQPNNDGRPPRPDSVAGHSRRTYHSVFAYGAYDLVGMNLRLTRAIPCDGPTVWLVPADHQAPSWEFARRFVTRHVSTQAAPLKDATPVRPFIQAARAFRDRDQPGGFLSRDTVELVHVQGPEAELTHVARAVLRDLADGIDPGDIGIVARTLEPYASVMESVFEQNGVPVDTGTGFPATRDPGVLAVVTLLRVLVDEFARQPVIDLLRSPAFQRPTEDETFSPNLWDRLSRAYSIAQGLESWTQTLPDIVDAQQLRSGDPDPTAQKRFDDNKVRQLRSLETLTGILERLAAARDAWSAARTSADHSARIRDLVQEFLRLRKNATGTVALDVALTALASLDEAVAAANRVTGSTQARTLKPRAVLEFLERTLSESPLPWSVSGGVALLDVMQARGLVFRKLYVVGFNADFVPRRPRESVFLSDATRRKLVERDHAIHVSTDTASEEHLLLAQTAAAVTGKITLSWQRADAEGKSMAVSLSLQEWSRVMYGGRTLRDRIGATHQEGGPWRLPTHPAEAVRALVQRGGMASPMEGALLLAHEAGREAPAAVERLLDRLPFMDGAPLKPSLLHVAAVEQFDPGDGAYDAVVSGHAWDGVFSPSGLETLGGCPLRFYFQKVLRIRPLDEVPDAHEIDPMDMGTRIHRILELIYKPLQNVDPKETPLESMIATAVDGLDAAWEETLDPVRRRMSARYPALWDATANFWRRELEDFVRRDLTRLHAQEWIIDSVEPPRDATFAISDQPGASTIELAGRLDRLCRGPDRYLVTDYKTGGNLDGWVKLDKLLPGIKLQLPLYTRMMSTRYPKAQVSAELLGLGPSFLPDSGFVRAEAVVLPDLKPDQEQGLWETIDILVRQTRAGSYPLHKDGPCDYCEFRDACRRRHVASVERQGGYPQNADYLSSRRKSSTKPTLAQVAEADRARGESGS